ncbi:hypothetical protein PRIPAC_93104 [Pristionchus pacificus]|uniref:Uncharacterized protein n=1 Tax=Pristionchus pacificus TaxID=54126 RepID=A0A2A6CDT5_PRIPA|nr:hypothetical protein PRIPAC_93104 [Pristionchus pacificus]|eukprot:PDM76250.1 hypothetical protein PRIPAC_39854 [Pristionchus pacificus]
MTSAEENEKAAPDKSNPKSYAAEQTTRAADKDNVTIPMKRRETYTESACEEETFHQEFSSISFGSLNFRTFL